MTPSPSQTLFVDTPQRSILDHIGQTPLLPLPRLARWAGVPDGTRIYAKAEHLNPGGSGKDRLALALLQRAEANGLARGGVVVEATSGNTGIALAQACAVRGYRLHVVASEKVSDEKVRILAAFGATVHRVPNRPHGHPEHYIERARTLAAELAGHYLDQFGNPDNSAVHERTTGPEILGQLQAYGRLPDAFVAGVGTGGTLAGIGRYLRRTVPTVRIVLADPVGSVLARGAPFAPYKVEGIGDDVVPELYDPSLVDEALTVPDGTAFAFALAAARHEGLLVGGSSGAHLAAAAHLAKRLPPGSTIVTLLPDSGRNYLSTFLDPAWCDANGHAAVWHDAPDADALLAAVQA